MSLREIEARPRGEEDYEEQRREYRDLIDELKDKAENSGAQGLDTDTLRMFVLKGNEIFSNVCRPREAALDAQFMKHVSQLASLNIRSSHSSLHEFKPTEFAIKLKSFYGRRTDRPLNSTDWTSITKASKKAFRDCYGIEPQVVAAEEKVRRAPVAKLARPRDKEAAKTDLAQVSKASSEEVQTEEVTRIYQILRRKFKENGQRPICLYSFVINPNSYGLTIENSFHTSFLVRDQHALITEDDDGLPVIAPDKPTSGQQATNQRNKQFALDFDVETFNKCIEMFSIKEPMITPRPRINGR